MELEHRPREFLIVDETGDEPLLRVALEKDPGEDVASLRFVESVPEPPDLMKREELCLVNIEEELVIRCAPIRQTRERITVKRSTATFFRFDRELKAPLRFESCIYPVSGDWSGRWAVRGIDLSCGGVAFSCGADLAQKEVVELALPLGHQPLLLQCMILHRHPSEEERYIYSAKFVELCREEEAMIRRAVFDLQLKDRRKTLQQEKR